jgi:hypothetical protein
MPLTEQPSLSRRTSANGSSSLIRRRSLVQTPGVATRNSPVDGRRRTWNSWKAPQVAPEEEAKWAITQKGITPLNRLMAQKSAEESPKNSAARAQTPSELDYGHLGSLKLGTLSIVNGEPSPAASMHFSKQAPSDGEVDYFTAEPGSSPLTMKSTRRRGHVKSKSLVVPGVSHVHETNVVIRPRTRDSDTIPQGPRQMAAKPLRITNDSPTSHDASKFAQDYQAYIPDSPFANAVTFNQDEHVRSFHPENILPMTEDVAGILAGTMFDAPTTALEASGSVLFTTAPRVSNSPKQGSNRRPAPRTADSGYSSGGSLRTSNGGRLSATSMNSARSSKNSIPEASTPSPALSRESNSPTGYNYQALANVNKVEARRVPALLNVPEQFERPSTSDSLLSPTSVTSKSSLDSTSSKSQKRLQKRRPSQPELPMVQSCQSIPEATVPDIPDNVRAKFTRRLSNTPGMECLTHTYPTKDHVLTAGSEASIATETPVEPVTQLVELEPEQPPPPAHKRHRSLSLFRRKSTVESQDADKEDGNASFGVVDLGTIASSLGSSPYDAAMSVPLRKSITSPTHPHQLGSALPRAKSMVNMDSEAAAEFARMRSKDRAHAEQEMPQLQQQQKQRRRSFHNLKVEAGETKASRRRQNQSVHDIPPVPTIDASKFKVEQKTDVTFNARAQAKGQAVSQLINSYDKHEQNSSMQNVDWDAHSRHWSQRRKSIGEGLRSQTSFGEATASTVNTRNHPVPRVDLAAWGRFSGGLDYNYEGQGGAGVGGSAGTRSLHSKASSKSMQWKHQYGVDLSDVPIMLQRV